MNRMRYDVTFTGRVQGVGFRATVNSMARGFDVAGWVRNEPDGSVRCVAEGNRDELDRFVQAIEDAMSGYVQDKQVNEHSATGEFPGFTVRY